MTTPITFPKLPGVLAFQRGLLISDAAFYNQFADGKQTPLQVVRHGIRGTQNINKPSKTDAKDPSGDADANTSTTNNAKRQGVSNVQITDTAKLDHHASHLVVTFQLRLLDLADTLFSCAPAKDDTDKSTQSYREIVCQFVKKAKESVGIEEVARRFARNILNGRWLWRNRTIAKAITVHVTADQGVSIQADALAIPLHHFDNYTAEELAVADFLAKGLKGNLSKPALQVTATIAFGIQGAVEVFPSQNYVENKPKGFARPLYTLGDAETWRMAFGEGMTFKSTRIMGQAALRDQKISNALRTIDTWYPDFKEHKRILPVEPNGASLDAQAFFRSGKSSAFQYAKQLNKLDPNSPEGMFMIASLIRGGVFSGGNE
ncbi:CRISPR-associated protein Csy3 [Chitinivorax tropicus]|uniref:CRISPR-associated protein Csy3 n=1 Tax=Chitinivorax tropicus TaxID=714531 RepID=A0A840MGU7_9PROT|nr:type I-F CRISPR-associated protein Csy3 [Chitinivorax tropicus]MBB5018454.1 CRISPR-associated protein Csy3 [Chitinivorax tropicus]